MSARPSTPLLWFGVLGGGVAWLVQFCTNLYFTWAQCNQTATRWGIPVHDWEIGLSVGALVVGVAATAVAARIFLSTYRIPDVDAQELRGDGYRPPVGRIHFLAINGLVVNFSALWIIIMTGVGAPLLTVCQQA